MARVAGAHSTTVIHALDQSKARAEAERRLAALLRPTLAARVVDSAVKVVGSRAFVNFNLIWIGCWIIINLSLIPGIVPFDPFPFRLLMLILPSEALLLVLLTAANRRRLKNLSEKLARLDELTDMVEGDGRAIYGADRGACSPDSGTET